MVTMFLLLTPLFATVLASHYTSALWDKFVSGACFH